MLPEAPKKSSTTKDSKDKEKTKWDEYKEAVRDLKTTWLAKLGKIHETSLIHSLTLYIYLCVF